MLQWRIFRVFLILVGVWGLTSETFAGGIRPLIQEPLDFHFSNLSHLEAKKVRREIDTLQIQEKGSYQTKTVPYLSMCSCTKLESRIQIILNQLNDLVILRPFRDEKLVHTAFAEEGLLQTYLFARAAQAIGYHHIELKVIAPSLTETLFSDLVPQLKSLSAVKKVTHYRSSQDYISAVKNHRDEKSHSFDMIDPDNEIGQQSENQIFQALPPSQASEDTLDQYSQITLDDVSDLSSSYRGDHELFRIYIAQVQMNEQQVTCGANLVALGRAILYDPESHDKFWSKEIASTHGYAFAQKFCQEIASIVSTSSTRSVSIRRIIAYRNNLVTQGILKNRMYHASAKRTYDERYLSLPAFVSHGAEANFLEMIEKTKSELSAVYVLKNLKFQRHRGTYIPQGISWNEEMVKIF